jgi:hypothetical protein
VFEKGGGERGDQSSLTILQILERRARAPTVTAILKDENAIKVPTEATGTGVEGEAWRQAY